MSQQHRWIAIQPPVTTSGPSGSETNPFIATTADQFDAIMRDLSDANPGGGYHIHLGPGTFYTLGLAPLVPKLCLGMLAWSEALLRMEGASAGWNGAPARRALLPCEVQLRGIAHSQAQLGNEGWQDGCRAPSRRRWAHRMTGFKSFNSHLTP